MNREVFLLNYEEEFSVFNNLYNQLKSIASAISERSDKGKSHVDLIPFLFVIIRQASNAFECLSRYQVYDSWLIFRPALEATLFIGKFLDDPYNARLWKNRKKIWKNQNKNKSLYKRYKREFDGKGLVPKSLRYGEEFRQLLSKINDEFVHMNYEYYQKSHSRKGINSKNSIIKTLFVTEDPQEHKAFLFSFLHVYYLIVFSIREAFAPEFKKVMAVNIDIDKFEKNWHPKIIGLIKDRSDLKEICQSFGFWEV